jgi:chromosomal replication initiation ATPase DnaA
MKKQNIFKYQLNESNDLDNFFVNSTNVDAFNFITNEYLDNIFLIGPKKSGKTHLLNIWSEINKAIIFNNNFNTIIESNKNVAFDNILSDINEEEVFHIINHCKNSNLKILLTSSYALNNYKFILADLKSRIKTFNHSIINDPDDEMCKIILTKLLHEKQVIVKNKEIFEFIYNRVNRTYKDIYLVIEKIDQLSLEKKRQLTIPLIKEIL